MNNHPAFFFCLLPLWFFYDLLFVLVSWASEADSGGSDEDADMDLAEGAQQWF
jgi:hypothetical protein